MVKIFNFAERPETTCLSVMWRNVSVRTSGCVSVSESCHVSEMFYTWDCHRERTLSAICTVCESGLWLYLPRVWKKNLTVKEWVIIMLKLWGWCVWVLTDYDWVGWLYKRFGQSLTVFVCLNRTYASWNLDGRQCVLWSECSNYRRNYDIMSVWDYAVKPMLTLTLLTSKKIMMGKLPGGSILLEN